MCLTRVTRENFTGFPREIHMLLLVGMVFFLCFGSYILQPNLILRQKISSNALTKLRSENLWKLCTTIINRPMRLQLIICHKKELLSSLL